MADRLVDKLSLEGKLRVRLTMAQLQGHFLKYKRSPRLAVERCGELVAQTSSKKASSSSLSYTSGSGTDDSDIEGDPNGSA